MKINREKLLELYMTRIYKICDDLPDKSRFEIPEIINIVSDIIEENNVIEDNT